MKIHDEIEQGSVEWQWLRAGKITASEVDALVTPLGKVRDSEGVDSYLAKKVCELWTGAPLPTLQVFDMLQGELLEDRAKPAFTIHTGIEARNVGFIETDDGRCGCSPDLLIDDWSGVEIKAPRIDTHANYLLSGKLPKAYAAQVQMSMFVTGFRTWHFFSFNRQLPPLHLVIDRDEKFQAALETAISNFSQQLQRAMELLESINGGPPPKRPTITPRKPEESFDVPMP